jgi:hypothetical protein
MEGLALIALATAAVVIGFFLIRQSNKKGRWGIDSLTTTCPRCRHAHACASQTHISRGRDVGRMDVPEMGLQG